MSETYLPSSAKVLVRCPVFSVQSRYTAPGESTDKKYAVVLAREALPIDAQGVPTARPSELDPLVLDPMEHLADTLTVDGTDYPVSLLLALSVAFVDKYKPEGLPGASTEV